MGGEVFGPQALGHYVDEKGNITGFICGGGCCPGCWRCSGMGMGCHQSPCRCKHKCSCLPKGTDIHSRTCKRHGGRTDIRPTDAPPSWFTGMRCPTCDPARAFVRNPGCDTCGGVGAINKAPADYIVRCLERVAEHTVCEANAVSYIWPKNGPTRWRPVCIKHRRVFESAGNILESDRI